MSATSSPTARGVLATADPELQRFYAKRMGARSTEVKASHVPFLSQPAVARLIEQAAGGR